MNKNSKKKYIYYNMNINSLNNWQYSNINILNNKYIKDIILPVNHDSAAYKFDLNIPIHEYNSLFF